MSQQSQGAIDRLLEFVAKDGSTPTGEAVESGGSKIGDLDALDLTGTAGHIPGQQPPEQAAEDPSVRKPRPSAKLPDPMPQAPFSMEPPRRQEPKPAEALSSTNVLEPAGAPAVPVVELEPAVYEPPAEEPPDVAPADFLAADWEIKTQAPEEEIAPAEPAFTEPAAEAGLPEAAFGPALEDTVVPPVAGSLPTLALVAESAKPALATEEFHGEAPAAIPAKPVQAVRPAALQVARAIARREPVEWTPGCAGLPALSLPPREAENPDPAPAWIPAAVPAMQTLPAAAVAEPLCASPGTDFTECGEFALGPREYKPAEPEYALTLLGFTDASLRRTAAELMVAPASLAEDVVPEPPEVQPIASRMAAVYTAAPPDSDRTGKPFEFPGGGTAAQFETLAKDWQQAHVVAAEAAREWQPPAPQYKARALFRVRRASASERRLYLEFPARPGYPATMLAKAAGATIGQPETVQLKAAANLIAAAVFSPEQPDAGRRPLPVVLGPLAGTGMAQPTATWRCRLAPGVISQLGTLFRSAGTVSRSTRLRASGEARQLRMAEAASGTVCRQAVSEASAPEPACVIGKMARGSSTAKLRVGRAARLAGLTHRDYPAVRIGSTPAAAPTARPRIAEGATAEVAVGLGASRSPRSGVSLHAAAGSIAAPGEIGANFLTPALRLGLPVRRELPLLSVIAPPAQEWRLVGIQFHLPASYPIAEVPQAPIIRQAGRPCPQSVALGKPRLSLQSPSIRWKILPGWSTAQQPGTALPSMLPARMQAASILSYASLATRAVRPEWRVPLVRPDAVSPLEARLHEGRMVAQQPECSPQNHPSPAVPGNRLLLRVGMQAAREYRPWRWAAFGVAGPRRIEITWKRPVGKAALAPVLPRAQPLTGFNTTTVVVQKSDGIAVGADSGTAVAGLADWAASTVRLDLPGPARNIGVAPQPESRTANLAMAGPGPAQPSGMGRPLPRRGPLAMPAGGWPGGEVPAVLVSAGIAGEQELVSEEIAPGSR